jgi:enamine deaminase RidA (YjgF/YER057c/UK114 family)
VGIRNSKDYRYEQAIKLGNRLSLSGQGGWDIDTTLIDEPTDQCAQIIQAFKNIDRIIVEAGGRGRQDVYAIKTYHTALSEEALERVRQEIQGDVLWQPIHVESLAFQEMLVEIQVEAWLA